MAIVDDWVVRAAEEIYNDGEHYRDTPPGVIAEIIERHCPFARGVAYMPVQCARSPDGRHRWEDVTTLGASAKQFICAFCQAEANEPC